MLDWTARSIYEKAKVAQNLTRAKLLRKIVDEKFKGSKKKTEQEILEIRDLHLLLVECYEVITDDLLLISSLELIAKRKLVAKCYVIHQVKAPKSLCNEQKRKPIHARTIQAMERAGKPVSFRESTIGISVLLGKRYRQATAIPDHILSGVQIARRRRNLIHFHVANFYTVETELLNFIGYLNEVIPSRRG